RRRTSPMHCTVRRIINFTLAAVAAAALPVVPAAAWQPTTNIEYIVPAGPGGAVDTYGRIMAKIFDDQKMLGQPLLILNKPGGAGMIAANELIRKPGDANLFAMFSTGYIISSLLGDFRHDLQNDFTMGPV